MLRDDVVVLGSSLECVTISSRGLTAAIGRVRRAAIVTLWLPGYAPAGYPAAYGRRAILVWV